MELTMDSLFCVKDKNILITGANGHIGKAISKALLERGAILFVCLRSPAKQKEFLKELSQHSSHIHSIVCDLEDARSSEEIAQFVSQKTDVLHVLINNAYSGKAGSTATSTSQDVQDSFELGMLRPYELVKQFTPFLKKAAQESTDASIINIASMYGIVSPDLSVYEREEARNPPYYGAMKAALIQITRYWAVELAPMAIRCNAISPGAFPQGPVQKTNPDFVERLAQKSPLKRIGRPEELVGAVIYLASDASSYTTGSNLVVDGGWTAW